MNQLNYANTISATSNPTIWTKENCQIMVKACRELAIFHYDNCPEIKSLYDRYNFDPNSIDSDEDLKRIPMLGVTAMKTFLITSLPHDQMVLKLTSSGTKGQKTQIWFDQPSFDRVQKMLDVLLEQEGLVSNQLTNYLVFNYDPDDAGDLGVAYTEKNQLRFAPVKNVFYAIKKNTKGEWAFQKEKALEILQNYELENIPVRIMGMPAFLFEFIDFLDGRQFKSHNDSAMITGGGWKAAEDKKVSRAQFRDICSETFGIRSERIRDAFGMAEHCAPYFECAHHRFHVPAFNRIFIRDPQTLEVLPDGEVGLMQLITPFNTMMPTLSLLSTDWAIIDNATCSCGVNSPTFSLLGRAGISKHKGCALHADQIVKRRQS